MLGKGEEFAQAHCGVKVAIVHLFWCKKLRNVGTLPPSESVIALRARRRLAHLLNYLFRDATQAPPRVQSREEHPAHLNLGPRDTLCDTKRLLPVNFCTRAIIHQKNILFCKTKKGMSLFPKNIHRIGFLNPKSHFFQNYSSDRIP